MQTVFLRMVCDCAPRMAAHLPDTKCAAATTAATAASATAAATAAVTAAAAAGAAVVAGRGVRGCSHPM